MPRHEVHVKRVVVAEQGGAAPAAKPTGAKRQRALVYGGEGAGTRSVLSAVESLRAALPQNAVVESFAEEDLLDGAWIEDCALLVVPGGADLPYCRQLNGAGNCLIRRYVERGGSYLGLCAGAYYACRRVEFELGSRHVPRRTPRLSAGRLEVCGDRELAFFPGIARGSAFPGFDYETEAGAVAAALRFRPHHIDTELESRPDPVGHSTNPEAAQPTALASIGSLSCNLPRNPGMRATEEELGSDWVVVTKQDAAEAADDGTAVGDSCGTAPASTRPEAAEAAAGAAARDRCGDGAASMRQGTAARGPEGSSWEDEPARGDCPAVTWERCVDYCNGGPVFCPDAGAAQPGAKFFVLATYVELGGAAAAVSCRVGAGRVVLCGTHPELAPHWLDKACGVQEEGVCEGVPRGSGQAAGVRAALAAGAPARRRFWDMLLSEAGVVGLH